MDLSMLCTTLLSTQAPLLPEPMLQRLYLALAWGLVLGVLATRVVLRRTGSPAWIRIGLPLALVLWCLLPGGISPAHWLGLAFRAPSLLLVMLCIWLLLRDGSSPQHTPSGYDLMAALRRKAWAPVLLGWALLLDTFALWPISLYAVGFAPLAVGVLAMLGLLPYFFRRAGFKPALPLLAVLVAYVGLRLPSGNVWDAVLDPCLWLWLQLDWLWRRRRSA